MKKLLAVILASLFILSLCACSDKNTDDKNNGAVSKPQAENAAQQTEQQNTHKTTDEQYEKAVEQALEAINTPPQYPEDYMTLETATKLYERANEAVGWIVRTKKVAVYPEETISVDISGMAVTYYRVRPDCHYGLHDLTHHAQQLGNTSKLIFNLDTLEAYLATVVGEVEAEMLIMDLEDEVVPMFVERDNKLYAHNIIYTPEGFSDEETYTFADNGDDTFDFTVSYSTLNDDGSVKKNKSKTFTILKENGRYVFSDFRVIKQN